MIMFCLFPSVDTEVSSSALDVKKYMGLWYEIARYDHWFERGLVGVTAHYSLNADGTIKVINSGYKQTLNGNKKTAVGHAKMPDKNIPRHLRVSFFLWFYSDYNILELDQENYNYVLVGSSSDKYLWILSRTPTISPEKLDHLLELAQKRGYDTNKLIMTPQK